MKRFGKLLIASVVVLAAAGAGYYAWLKLKPPGLPAGIVSTNGRVEATQVDISTKIPGRVIEIVPHEGDMVSPGEVVARIDTSETLAQFHQAQASAELARQTLVTRQAEVASDEAQLNFANEELRRTATLVSEGWSTHELLDQRNQQLKSADAALKAAMSHVDEARATVKTADARVEELQAVIDNSTIKSRAKVVCSIALSSRETWLPPGGSDRDGRSISMTSTRRCTFPLRRLAGLKSGMTPTPRASSSTPTRTTSSRHRSHSSPPEIAVHAPRPSRSSQNASSSTFGSSCKSRPACSRAWKSRSSRGCGRSHM